MNTSRVVRAGDSSLVVELDDRIDPDINVRAVACATHVRIAAVPGVRDVVPAFRTVTIYFNPLQTDIHRLVAVVEDASTAPDTDDVKPGRAIENPVCYGGAFGPDLDDVAERARLSADEVVAIHTARAYRVFMLGFVPGFSYMGIVDERIATPRRSVPRTMVEAGSNRYRWRADRYLPETDAWRMEHHRTDAAGAGRFGLRTAHAPRRRRHGDVPRHRRE
ncbi:MAG: allophanate hydrolase subunit 1 [Vicinamibacterales bacterium]